MANTKATLIVGPAWVGDMVMAQSLFKQLKRIQPEYAIDVLAPRWSVPMLERMPEVRQAIVLDVGHGEFGLMKRWSLGRSLRKQYQQAFVLPRSLKSALVPFFAGIPLRIGYIGETRYGLLNRIREFDTQRLDQTVKRYVNLALDGKPIDIPIDYPLLTTNPQRQEALRQTLGLSDAMPAIALMPGAEFGPSKQWPVEHYRQIAIDLTAKGYQVWVLGSPKDQPAGAAIVAEGLPNVHNLCGKTALADAVDLIALCKGAVSNDSGLMHVAAAVRCPVVALYGATSPTFAPPLEEKAASLSLNLACSPCRERQCPLGHKKCLQDIAPTTVMAELEALQ